MKFHTFLTSPDLCGPVPACYSQESDCCLHREALHLAAHRHITNGGRGTAETLTQLELDWPDAEEAGDCDKMGQIESMSSQHKGGL